MARKEITFTVTTNGRDKGKQFKITEMAARQAEEWAIRVACAMMSTGVSVPDNVISVATSLAKEKPKEEDVAAIAIYESVMASGMIALAKFGATALAKIPFNESKPLMDELMSCVQYVAGPTISIPLDVTHIEEASTYFRLKVETLKLHVSFLTATAS